MNYLSIQSHLKRVSFLLFTLVFCSTAIFAQTSPTANAGIDFTACETDISLSGSAENYEALLWATSGDGVFSAPDALFTAYTPGSADISAGYADLCLTAFGAGEEATDCVTVTIVPAPQIEIGFDQMTICYELAYTFETTQASDFDGLQWYTISGAGYFDNENVLNPTYFPSPTIDYPQGCIILGVLAQGNGPCSIFAQDEIELCFQPSAQVDLGGETHYACYDQNYTFADATASGTAFLQWVSLSGGGYFENENSINATYVPDPEFDYPQECIYVMLFGESIAPCTTAIEELVGICFLPAPEVDAGADATVWSDDSFTPEPVVAYQESVLWETSGDGSFSDPTQLNPQYFPGYGDAQNGSVILSLKAFTQANCPGPIADELLLTVTTQQNIELPQGVSGLSSFVNTQGLTFEQVIAPISGELIFAQNNNQVYWPEYGINTINDFSNLSAYKVTLSSPATLTIVGTKTMETTVDLPQGWSNLPVPVSCNIGFQELINQLGANLIIVAEMDGGEIIWPEGGIYSLTELLPGKAYMIKMENAAQLVFPVCE